MDEVIELRASIGTTRTSKSCWLGHPTLELHGQLEGGESYYQQSVDVQVGSGEMDQGARSGVLESKIYLL